MANSREIPKGNGSCVEKMTPHDVVWITELSQQGAVLKLLDMLKDTCWIKRVFDQGADQLY